MTDSIIINRDLSSVGRGKEEWKFSFDDMFSALEQLTALLAEENALLESMQVSSISRLQEQKSNLTWLLELQKSYLSAHPELVGALPEAQKQRIMQSGEQLEKVLEKNYRLISAARFINQKVVQAMTAVLSDSFGTASGYGETGARGLMIGKDRTAMQPLALNQAI